MVEVISSPSQSPNQDSPAEEVQVKEHQQTLSRQLQDLATAQPDSQKPDNQLVSEIAALKELMAAKELGWEQERQKIMKDLRSERELRKTAQADKNKTSEKEIVEVISSPSQSPNQDSPAEEVQVKEHQQTLSRQLQDLPTAQPDSQKPDNMLVSENAALKELMAAKELGWEQERQKMMKALRSERELRKTAQADKRQELQRQSREMEDWCNQKEEEIKLLTQQNADLQVHNLSLQELAQQTDKEKAQFKKEEKKLRQTVLSLESCATLKDSELIGSEVEWKIKLTALEDRMRCELAAKEESFQREQELQRQSREMEDWCNQKEEEIKLLTQQNADLHVHNLSLQELAQQTDKEKAQFKKEEKKARKEAEEREKKENEKREKEELKRQKKERKENEEREKEEVKRQKKERKENEIREKEEVKRQKKERKENEEREKEEVKRQKKEKKLMEKREKVRT
ncbi:hypothetical protein VZT92_004002 [Zoarces viviparus]